MQQQYNQIKLEYPEHLILFRLGDFYEAFNQDATICANVLGITLTGRGKDDNRTPMAGIPYHALDNYLPKLLAAGHKIAITEQTSAPAAGKLVNRSVVRVFTPGTLISEGTLTDSVHNLLASVYFVSSTKTWCLAVGDTSTNQVWVGEYTSLESLNNYISGYGVKEIIYCQPSYIPAQGVLATNILPSDFELNHITQLLEHKMHLKSLAGFGVKAESGIYNCLSGYISYYNFCYKTQVTYLKINQIATSRLDINTIKNLDILFNNQNSQATIYQVVNNCFTHGGKRLLRLWLIEPLTSPEKILERQNLITWLINAPITLKSAAELLQQIGDIERLVGKLTAGIANPKDLNYLALSITGALQLVTLFDSLANWQLSPAAKESLSQFASLITNFILPNPSANIADGYVVNLGIDPNLDQLRELSNGGKVALGNIQTAEVAATGISNLKIGFNNVFGYFIEISNSHKHKVPGHYTRKQTMTGAERYITPELKELETKILSAQAQMVQLEKDLYANFTQTLLPFTQVLLNIADLVSKLDILCGWAIIAREKAWVAPVLGKQEGINIQDGIHPVVANFTKEFTPNSTNLNSNTNTVIITGPNMAGKSTYIRQVAVLTLLAQAGSYVPASSMEFTPVDQIYTRVGAADNLAAGSSTFMVEMFEAANILNNATSNSLVILDEVGRGTSTYDGLAIATAMVEYLATQIKCKTLFATHYHELISLQEQFSQISNAHVEGIEQGDSIKFTHKLKPGGASKSYGIQVAKLAGVPISVINRSNQVLQNLTNSANKHTTAEAPSKDATISQPTPIAANINKQSGEQLSLL